MPKKPVRGSMIAAAVGNPATAVEKATLKRNRAIATSNDLLLPDEVDLSPLQEMSVPELLQQIDADIKAVDELELHVYRHVVRIAACIKELRDRDEQAAIVANQTFSKTAWNKIAQEKYFQGRLAKSQMYVYQKLARPENHDKAREFQQKIQIVRELKQTFEGDETRFSGAVEKAGIPCSEVDLLPPHFSLKAFERYLKASKRLTQTLGTTPQKKGTATALGKERGLVKKQKRLVNRLKDAELRYFEAKPVLEKLDLPEVKAALKDANDMRKQIDRLIDEYSECLEQCVAQVSEL